MAAEGDGLGRGWWRAVEDSPDVCLQQRMLQLAPSFRPLAPTPSFPSPRSKTTIDGVYAQLQRAEVEGEAGVHGASTTEVLESLAQVQGEARHAFGPLLERAAKADRLRLVLGAMRRYEALVGLPARARQHAEAGDYEQVGGWVGGHGLAAGGRLEQVCCHA